MRGILLILASVPLWLYVRGGILRALKGPFGSEFGSMTYHLSARVAAIELIALSFTIIGLAVLVLDFADFVREKRK